MKNIAVFISGTGSNLRTIAEFCQHHSSYAKIDVVISNKANVYGLEIAKEFNLKTVVIPTKGRTMIEFENECGEHLQNVNLICLAGFMRVLSQSFTKTWHGKMINIHPSLLPSFKGGNAVSDALNYGVKITGCTVHFVEEEVDSGRIISQKSVNVFEDDTEKTLHERIKSVEKEAYVEAMEKLCLV